MEITMQCMCCVCILHVCTHQKQKLYQEIALEVAEEAQIKKFEPPGKLYRVGNEVSDNDNDDGTSGDADVLLSTIQNMSAALRNTDIHDQHDLQVIRDQAALISKLQTYITTIGKPAEQELSRIREQMDIMTDNKTKLELALAELTKELDEMQKDMKEENQKLAQQNDALREEVLTLTEAAAQMPKVCGG